MQNQQLSDVKGKELVAAGHAFAKAIGMDTPLIEIAKMVSELAARLDCALVRGDELEKQRDALAAENAAFKSAVIIAKEGLQEHYDTDGVDSQDSEGNLMDACIRLCDAQSTIEKLEDILTPATDAYLNSVRAEGVEMFAEKITKTVSDECKPDSHHAYAYIAMNFADKLRAGKDGE